MAGSAERVPPWPPSASNGGSELYPVVSNYVRGSQETQTESNYLGSCDRTKGSFGQPELEDDPPDLEQRLGSPLGSKVITGVTFNSPSSSQHQHSGLQEKMPEPSQRKGKRTGAQTGDKPAEEKRFRSPNWEDQERTSLLVGKLEFFHLCILQTIGVNAFNFNKSWSHYVADRTVGRCQKSCLGQWDTLLKDFKAICDHEEKIYSGTSSHVSFWTMTKGQKDIANQERSSAKLRELPREFQRAWCKLIELINQIQDALSKLRDAGKKTKNIRADPNLLSSSTAPIVTSTNTDSASDVLPGQPAGQRAKDKALDMDDHELISKIVAPIVNKQIADKVEPLISVLKNLEDDEKKHRIEVLALKERIQGLMQQLNTPLYSGVLAMGNVDSACPGAGEALNFEPSLPHDAQHIANSHDPSSGVLLDQSDANAGRWRSIKIDPEAETVVYSKVHASASFAYHDQQYASLHEPASRVIHHPDSNADAQLQAGVVDSIVHTSKLAYVGQHAIHQMQAPNEEFTAFSQILTQLSSKQASDQCLNTNFRCRTACDSSDAGPK